ncbi:ABC transporter permease [Salisediminibacterium halotolerans]|uniref:ABC-2 type transport system permease protein n=1 Tax=Salisediminibacterium halotolerans TaxID=517425 RepID=A0A1H9RVY4_9BACI|nr:ABC transporter permease [Salisediminibacterium haloalkalitolerans]SER76585.1 ABC-2 type transport system permease protein [Salisediminibacterium haloalkalitolerans]
MPGLIRNEWMKIYRRKGTKVMAALLIAVVIAVGLLSKYALPAPDEPFDGETAEEHLQFIEQEQSGNDLPPAVEAELAEQKQLYNYYVEENIDPIPEEHVWSFLLDNPQLVTFMTMFTVIVGAGTVAGEHASGTIKLLLIRPVKRGKILLSKWIATILFALMMLFVLLTATVVSGWVLYGFSVESYRVVELVNGTIRDMPLWQYTAAVYGLAFTELVIFTTFAFMIGTVFRNQSLAIGLSLVLLFTGGQIVHLLNDYEWIKYLLFAHTNTLQQFQGEPLLDGVTPLLSTLVLLSYFFIFAAAAWMVFTRRDVAD